MTFLQLDEISKCLILEGTAQHVRNAFTYLMHMIESFTIPEEQMINADVCGICCEEPTRPYRLQKCGHRFCMACLSDSLNMALGDISMFPIKCPHCLTEMVINDLDALLEDSVWPKLISMAVNQFVGKHQESYTFCFTAGCKQISPTMSDHFRCDLCNTAYCLECKVRFSNIQFNYHPRMTCEQAKNGSD